MNNILREPLTEYLSAKQTTFAGNILADKLRNEFPKEIESIIVDKTRYKVVGSPGMGNWAECPWIAILDTLITDSVQSGYYPVFLFKADMSGVYLSLNQGVTIVKENYKKDTKKVLKLRAEDFRAKLDIDPKDLLDIDLSSDGLNAKLYEAGNIIAKYYPLEELPSSEKLRLDIFHFLKLYEELTFNDTQLSEEKQLTAIEKKQYRLHFRIERNSSIAKQVKKVKGYICEACDFDFNSKYHDLGFEFIEAHHLKPISTLGIGKFEINLQTDFVVLCSNCHSMIHRLSDPSDLNRLREIIQKGY
ncbi:MAG: putative restriction endonuclease [Chitinophagaceae bacterium]|nr:putative restriction endonuclease [Chitinophagaceae bacterium]